MKQVSKLLFSLIYIGLISKHDAEGVNKPDKTVMVVLLITNKGHLLLPFLDSLQKLNYPKNLIDLYIRSDHNEDSTYYMLEYWLSKYGNEYNSVDKVSKFGELFYPDENEEKRWNNMRSVALIELKEDALIKARELERDYVWFLDVDVFFRNTDILQNLINEDKTVLAPKLDSVTKFSNFWGAMTDSFWYKRSDDYTDIVNYKKNGCFSVALVNSCVLVYLKHKRSDALTFMRHKIDHDSSNVIPNNDAVIFAISAQLSNIDQFVCNKEDYGAILLPAEHIPGREFQQLKNLGIIKTHQKTMITSETASPSQPNFASKINSAFDKIYCINIKSRQDRRQDMESKFEKLGLNVSFFDAFDWKDFNATFLSSIGLRQLKRYHENDMTYGMAGNFLSHYYIWEDIVNNDFQQVLILEDDVKFHDDFLERSAALLDEIEKLDLEWELLYLGRKILRSFEESPVSGTDMLLKPSYSYWTLAYMMSYNGAKKLLAQKPLEKIIPIDEYIPIMYDMHPEEKWSHHYHPRDLKAFAITPVICQPNYHKYKDQNYTSDTSTSPELSEVLDFDNDPRLYVNQKLHLGKTEL